MTTIGQTYYFESAHKLPLLPESHKCHYLHGHNYKIVITIEGVLDERGFVLDFAELNILVQPLLTLVDHKYLNDVKGLENPTAEIIAQWFLDGVKEAKSVRIYETDSCFAEVVRS